MPTIELYNWKHKFLNERIKPLIQRIKTDINAFDLIQLQQADALNGKFALIAKGSAAPVSLITSVKSVASLDFSTIKDIIPRMLSGDYLYNTPADGFEVGNAAPRQRPGYVFNTTFMATNTP